MKTVTFCIGVDEIGQPIYINHYLTEIKHGNN